MELVYIGSRVLTGVVWLVRETADAVVVSQGEGELSIPRSDVSELIRL